MITYKNSKGVIVVYLDNKKVGHIGIEEPSFKGQFEVEFRYYPKGSSLTGATFKKLRAVKHSLEKE